MEKAKIKMMPFDIEKAKQGAKLVTRDGKPARIVCWDVKDIQYPIIAIVKGVGEKEYVSTYTNKGHHVSDNKDTTEDLLIFEEPQYVPYKSAEEFMQAQREHGWYIKMGDRYNPYTDKDDDVWYVSPTEVTDKTLFFASIGSETDMHAIKYDKLVNYQWADGTPCGKIKEE